MIRGPSSALAICLAAWLLLAVARAHAQEIPATGETPGSTGPGDLLPGWPADPAPAEETVTPDEIEDDDEPGAEEAPMDSEGAAGATEDQASDEQSSAPSPANGLPPMVVRGGPKKQVYGWIEDVLIDPTHTLKLPAKLDTGADTTSLDARNIRRSRRDGEEYVRFVVTEPATGQSVELEKPFIRAVRIRGHGVENPRRVVVRMRICLGDRSRSIEVNLVDRAHYEYPLLLGRNALRDVAVIDPNLRRTREPSCWNAEPWVATPSSDTNEPAGGATAECENAPMC
jgi:hypothetical protein